MRVKLTKEEQEKKDKLMAELTRVQNREIWLKKEIRKLIYKHESVR